MNRLVVALGATGAVAALELIGGFLSGSLALLSDAVHVALDVVVLAIALAASIASRRPATARQSYGFARWEIIAALFNGGLLLAIVGFIVVEAIHRFNAPELPNGNLMAIVAAIGAVINGTVGLFLARGSHENINLRAAVLHVVSDALAGVGVVIGGLVILTLGWAWVDPTLSLVVAAVILFGAYRIVKDAVQVLLEGAPAHADVDTVRKRLLGIGTVRDIHDLHVWTIGTGAYAMSAHVLLDDARISEATKTLREIDTTLRDTFGITHVTVQFECEQCADDDTIVCTQTAFFPTPSAIHSH